MYIFVFLNMALFAPEEVQATHSQKDSTREGQQGKTRTGEWKTKQEQDNAKRWCWSDGALVATNHDGNVHIGHLTDGTLQPTEGKDPTVRRTETSTGSVKGATYST